MTENKKQVTLQGGKVAEGSPIDYETVKEHWNEYRLSNGAHVRLRLVPTEFLVTGEKNEAGDPVIAVSAQMLVTYQKPETKGET
jgi:hypothetical protein